MSSVPDPREAIAALTSTDVEAALDLARFGADGLLPAVVQDDANGEVLMLAWLDREALRRTLTEGRVTYWSRSRQEYWRKGDTSGNIQVLKTASYDCDADVVLFRIEQTGAACHTGSRACFTGRQLPSFQGDDR